MWQKWTPDGWILDEEGARQAFVGDAQVDACGVVRWVSNGAVPPVDVLEAWAVLCLPFDLGASTRARKDEVSRFLDTYRHNPPPVTAEMRAEMRASFGPGAKVVDVITGLRTRL